MQQYLTSTTSLCPQCRQLVPARVFVREDGIWFHKICPRHGPEEVRVYSDAKAYLGLNQFHRQASSPLTFQTAASGCPDSCGLCPEHEQHVCLPIIEITDHCNFECPICLVTTPGRYHRTPAEVARMLDGLIASEGQVDVLNLSGGEPTLNPHFREIIEECTWRNELVRVSISTNGSVLARDDKLLEFLREHNVVISLQFDGVSDDVYVALRGRPLLQEKMRLINRCADKGMSMSLTATIANDVNQDQVPRIADLLFQHEHILSVMFQPACYTGHATNFANGEQRATIPDIIKSLDGAAQGTVSRDDFSPLPCSHPACFSLAFYLKVEGNRFVPIKQMLSPERYLALIQNRAIFGTDAESFQHVTDAVYDLWSTLPSISPKPKISLQTGACSPDEPCACNQFLSDKALKSIRNLLLSATAGEGYSPKKAMSLGERSVKSIFIHHFMDPHTFDLSRARKCCQVYPEPDGRLMPACIYNCLRRNSE